MIASDYVEMVNEHLDGLSKGIQTHEGAEAITERFCSDNVDHFLEMEDRELLVFRDGSAVELEIVSYEDQKGARVVNLYVDWADNRFMEAYRARELMRGEH